MTYGASFSYLSFMPRASKATGRASSVSSQSNLRGQPVSSEQGGKCLTSVVASALQPPRVHVQVTRNSALYVALVDGEPLIRKWVNDKFLVTTFDSLVTKDQRAVREALEQLRKKLSCTTVLCLCRTKK